MNDVKHTFAICAYKDSPYLEACIKSLKGQTVASDIILCTSTPSLYIGELARAYGIPVFVRNGESDIEADWNFAYRMAQGNYVTIAHQDDMYHKKYTQYLYQCMERYPDMSLFTTGYATVKGHELKRWDPVAVVKALLRLPLRLRVLAHTTWLKKSVLMLGNSICCPACTYHKEMLGKDIFSSEFKYALDWDALCKLTVKPGRFICEEKPLIYYRVHDGATTKECIMDNRRLTEETKMFEAFWPKPLVGLIMYFYKKAYGAYN